jgi:hypothetical protein
MGGGGIAPPFLTSALDGDEWSASHNGSLTPRETVPSAQWIGSWVDPKAGLGTVEKEKSLATAEDRIPAVQPEACHYTDWAILTHTVTVVLCINELNTETVIGCRMEYWIYIWRMFHFNEVQNMNLNKYYNTLIIRRYAVAWLVEALCFKLEGRGFDSQ